MQKSGEVSEFFCNKQQLLPGRGSELRRTESYSCWSGFFFFFPNSERVNEPARSPGCVWRCWAMIKVGKTRGKSASSVRRALSLSLADLALWKCCCRYPDIKRETCFLWLSFKLIQKRSDGARPLNPRRGAVWWSEHQRDVKRIVDASTFSMTLFE